MVDPVILPPFPEAPLFDTREYEDAAEERKFALEGYLEFLINVDEVFNSRPAQIFYEFGHLLSPSNRKQVLMPLPSSGFDLTQVAVLWKVLTALGNCIVFATHDGKQAEHVPLQYEKGKGIPEAKRFYYELLKEDAFSAPLPFSSIDASSFSAVLLPGCYLPEVEEAKETYLDNKELHDKIRELWDINVPVGAVAQGVLLLCRTHDSSGKSLLHNRRTTSAQKYLEQAQYLLDFFSSESNQRGYSEDEVKGALQDPTLYLAGPASILQDTLYDSSSAFICVDGNYLSARSTTDIYTFAKKFADMVYHSKFPADK